jgi:hypothetical protein
MGTAVEGSVSSFDVKYSFWLCPAILFTAALPAELPKASFTLAIAAEHGSVPQGQPIWVKVILTNTSAMDIVVYRANSGDMDQGRWVYEAVVSYEDGETPPPTMLALSSTAGGSGGYIIVHPGGSLTDRVNFSQLYELNRPAKYKLKLKRLDKGTKTYVYSNEITASVTRPNR